MSAVLQQLDLDIAWEQWSSPPSLIDKNRLAGLPPQWAYAILDQPDAQGHKYKNANRQVVVGSENVSTMSKARPADRNLAVPRDIPPSNRMPRPRASDEDSTLPAEDREPSQGVRDGDRDPRHCCTGCVFAASG